MTDDIKENWVTIIICLSLLVVFLLFAWKTSVLLEHISNVGIKNITESLWCGSKGC